MVRSDLWQEDIAAGPAVGSYSATHKVTVGKGVHRAQGRLVYPTTGTAGATSSASPPWSRTRRARRSAPRRTNLLYSVGLAHVLVKGVKPGKYTIEVTGDYAVSDPDTIDSDSVNGRVVFLQAAQLAPR